MKFNVDAIANLQVLKGDAMDGFRQIIGFIENDQDLNDVRWAAYMLATVKWECANKWRPVEEFGHGKGKPYGLPVTVTDTNGEKYANIYYGRGYVQLTWHQNYVNLGQKIGLGNQLEIHPEKTLDPQTAYRIMSFGMRHGSFTGVGLPRYIHDDVCDYYNARYIINRLDQADKIAMFAQIFEEQLGTNIISETSEGSKK